MSILVIGSKGFLGKNLVNYFDKKNINYLEINKSKLNLLNYKSCEDFFFNKSFKFIVNCAAYVGGIAFVQKNPASIISHNLEMSLNLYKSISTMKTKPIIINPISNCVYPSHYSTYYEKNLWNGRPHSSVLEYAESRRATITIGNSYLRQYKIKSYFPIFSNMYGPYDHFDEIRSHALGAIIYKAINAKNNNLKNITIWGDGSPKREWLYVEDACESIFRIIKSKPKENLFNVGYNSAISIKKLTDLIVKAVKFKGNIKFDKSKPNGAKCKKVDYSLCKISLSWHPKNNLKNNLEKTIEWYLKNT